MKKIQFWRRTPPAIFPPILGLFGLGLAWRHATWAFDLRAGPAEALLGAVTVLFLFAAGAYVLKVASRAAVVGEDMRSLPGRAGVAALTMSTMLMAVTLLPYSLILARLALFTGLAGHLLLMGETAFLLIRGPAARRVVTPVMHLTFVGAIVAPIGAIPLGYIGLSEAIFAACALAALVIWATSLAPLLLRREPAPLRPVQAIHLSPAALLGIVALMLGRPGLGLAFGIVATMILALLLARTGWLTEAGFSPFWGSFTFPAAAYANLMIALAAGSAGEAARTVGGVTLVGASLMIPPIVLKVMQAWAKGTLAAKTNSATA